jgi:CRISPR-associated protein Csd1
VTGAFSDYFSKRRTAAAAAAAAMLREAGFTSSGERRWRGITPKGNVIEVALSAGFPDELPEVFKVAGADGHVAHVDRLGKVCIAPDSGTLLDTTRPEDIVKDAIERADSILEAKPDDQAKDILREYESYWAESTSHIVSICPPKSETGECWELELESTPPMTLVAATSEAAWEWANALQDARRDVNGRAVPRMLVVPGQAKPSGSGINPGFLWDNSQYMLGFKADDAKPDRTKQAFEAFRDRHLAAERDIADESFSAVCRFLGAWAASDAAAHEELADIIAAFGVFRIAGTQEYVHERPKVRSYCLAQSAADLEAPRAPSLVSGEVQAIARLHEPKIKSVRGAQSSGATLVAFNADAYESYGKSQSFNAPVGIDDAFKYCTALNSLTTARDRQVHLGDTTVAYWSEKPTDLEDELFGVFEGTSAEDPVALDRLKGFFNRLRRASDGAPFTNGDVPFYILGLAPNAARISVRFWLAGTVQQFAERLGQHLADLEIGGAPPNMPPISLQRIIDQTARERDDIMPLLSGAVVQAVLSGGPYPAALMSAVLRRIRADGQLGGISGHIRAAIVKATLVRKARFTNQQEIVSMSLDKDCPRTAYQLGRLFAALEKTQEDAQGGELNVTIKDRFFSSASANPVAAFPRLLRLHAHHLNKLGTDKRGLKIVREKLVQDICERIHANDGFPAHLPLDDQGFFFIGYYHQRQALFACKPSVDNHDNTMSAVSAAEE